MSTEELRNQATVGAIDKGSDVSCQILRNILAALSNFRKRFMTPCQIKKKCYVPGHIFSDHMSVRPKRPHVALSMLGV